jgi:hypothetical protein
VTCRDEKRPVELRERFRRDGLECRALLAQGSLVGPAYLRGGADYHAPRTNNG